jgi:hypothetical protein
MANLETKNSQIAPAKTSILKSFFARLKRVRGGIKEETQSQLANLDPQPKIDLPRQKPESYFPDAESHAWDKNKDFFRNFKYKHESVSPEIKLIRDVELTFYVVKKDDTISEIRRKLTALPEFNYLSRSEYSQKMYGFNINPKDIKTGMLIPIPLESRERIITDEQFTNYCQKAIKEMKTDEIYGEKTQQLLKKFSEENLVELMIAVAKQESGGRPLGQFEFHRWENAKHIRAFSFSIFHVVMKGPGIKARKRLKKTEGQTYHPKNAAKLFLAFLFEKAQERNDQVENFLPLGKENSAAQFDKFAKFYNGNLWKKYNPKYVKNLKKYLANAHDLLNGDTIRPLKEPSADDEIRLAAKKTHTSEKSENIKAATVPEKIVSKSKPQTFEIGSTNLRQAILDANWLTLQETKINHLQSNKNVKFFVNRILKYIKKRYPQTGTTYFTNDKIGVSRDKVGLFLIFERRGNRAILRISNSKENTRKPKFKKIGKNLAFRAILNSNLENGNVLKIDQEASVLAGKLEKYLQRKYNRKTYFTSDEIAVWCDEKGPYLIFRRGENSDIIRP